VSLKDLRRLHSSYLEEVKAHLDDGYTHDASMRPEGLHHLIRLLESSRATSLGEFGAGLSTVGLRAWKQRTGRDIRFSTIEHDESWCRFMAGVLEGRNLPVDDIYTLAEYRNETLMMSAPPFDAVFVDHGPTMASRWNDVPWIVSLVKPGGLIIFDDWWPGHVRAFRSTKRIIRILTRMGLQWSVLEASRPNKNDKALAVVEKP